MIQKRVSVLSPCSIIKKVALLREFETFLFQQVTSFDLDTKIAQFHAERRDFQVPKLLYEAPKASSMNHNPSSNFVGAVLVIMATFVDEEQITHLGVCGTLALVELAAFAAVEEVDEQADDQPD